MRNNIQRSNEARNIGRNSAKMAGNTTNSSSGIIIFQLRPIYSAKSCQDRRVGGIVPHKSWNH